MIADDDADDCEFFCEAIKEIDSSAECLIVHNGEEGLEKLREGTTLPHYIFMDLNMPRINGRQFLEELKKDYAFKHIPVIIFSTSSAEKDKNDSYELGAAYFLTKPYNFQKLKEEIIFVMTTNWSQEHHVDLLGNRNLSC
jgi:CheY-like chemotaxis protein